ncbi:MAG: 30S ribosomal protein S8 [bacterium]|nr:30S ribosomal protein S8 [bacterium]
MPVTDPIADLLTRIRNAIRANKRLVDCPSSNIKLRVVDILAKEGSIRGYKVEQDTIQGTIRIALRFDGNGKSVISGLRRVSKPGLRQYRGTANLPRVRNNLGIAIMSTPEGVITNKEARTRNVGGEVLCYIW